MEDSATVDSRAEPSALILAEKETFHPFFSVNDVAMFLTSFFKTVRAA